MPDSCATLIGEYRYASIRGFPYALVFRRRTAGVVVIVADSADEIGKARLELCAQIPDEQGNLEVATGDAWLSVTLSTVGIGPAQVAEALGGTVSKITEYCAT